MEDENSRFFFETDKDGMNIDEYLQRINDITKYYFESCEKYKKRFYTCCMLRMISSSLIPIVSLASTVTWSTVIVSILAGIITLTEGYVNVSRAYEKWTKYRETCNALWIEQRFFSMGPGNYSDTSTRVEHFVTTCEGIMANEADAWKRYIERANEMK